jgi:RimJ/RimL family protein N-acetyltransferase
MGHRRAGVHLHGVHGERGGDRRRALRSTTSREAAAPLSIQVPVLTTPRLVLRGFEERDFDAYADMLADPEVARFLSDGKPLGRRDAWRHLAMVVGHWALRGFGLWAVEERESGALVGRIGLVEPAEWPGFELAYTLRRQSWGQGYAREAGKAALEYARIVLGRSKIISIIRPDNTASIRVATALGAERVGTVEFFGAPSDIYRYPSDSG